MPAWQDRPDAPCRKPGPPLRIPARQFATDRWQSRARLAIARSRLHFPGDQVIVVEGFFDCMRVHQAGFAGVVALMGARLSASQQELLTGRFSKIVLLLDGDATGRAATAQIAGSLAPTGSVTALLLPPGLQPDEMTADQIRQVLEGAERREGIGAN